MGDKELEYYTDRDLINDIAELYGLNKSEVAAIYKSMTKLIELNLQKGKMIKLRRIVSFKPRFYRGRVLRNYLNNNPDEVIKVEPKYGLKVIPSVPVKRAFDEAWNKNNENK